MDDNQRLAAAFASLVIGLVVAAEIHESNDPDAQHAGVMEALRSIGNFFDQTQIAHNALKPFHELVGAMLDAENGKRHQLLEPRSVDHAPPLPVKEQVIRGVAAAAVGLLMRGGKRKEVAARHVAERLRKSGFDIRGGAKAAPDWRIVARWRDQVMGAGGDTSRLDTGRYREMLTQVDKLGLDACVGAERLLTALENLNNTPS